jgi:FkbM family methyltransferase
MKKEMEGGGFFTYFAKYISASVLNDFKDNYDVYRYGRPNQSRQLVRKLCSRVGLTSEDAARNTVLAMARILEGGENGIDWIYRKVSDVESQDLLVRLMAFRALGHRKVRLPLGGVDYFEAIKKIERLGDRADAIDLEINGWWAPKTDLSTIGFPITLYSTAAAIYCQFHVEQYRCATSERTIEAEEGDVVLDCGACYGDTALYFAHKAGPEGKVYSFEFLPENLERFRLNLSLNPTLSKRVEIVEYPLWSASGEQLFIEGRGSGTRVGPHSSDPGALRVSTIAIDDLVRNRQLSRVDMIKMDIEGAELEALKGAEITLKRFRPKLAIAVYHRTEDFWEIPKYLDGLELGYEFYLRHFTIHAEETILFAVAKSS